MSVGPAVVAAVESTVPNTGPLTVLVEPYYGGSHKQFVDLLVQQLLAPAGGRFVTVTLPAKKWHWTMRTAALCVSQRIPKPLPAGSTLFASSCLNLAELLALRPDLAAARKLLYFHENQLTYPVKRPATAATAALERDFQFGWIQIMAAMVADAVYFNSSNKQNSFLGGVASSTVSTY